MRALTLGVVDATGTHPWVAAQLSRDSSQAAILAILATVGAERCSTTSG